MTDLATETLQLKRQQLLLEKEKFLERIDAEINHIEAAIERLSGKKVWETEPTTQYDDESHDYIKGSFEEM
jgi:hypothetical protein